MEFYIAVAAVFAILIFFGVKIVPQQEAWILELFGKFDHIMQPGLNFIIPFVHKVAYRHSLKEQAIDVNQQTAITKDNVTLNIDGVLYMKIIDPVAASYGASNPHYALIQIAQTNMRSEIGKISLDKTFEERESLNINIVNSINEASNSWGIQCMRYEIKDIEPPTTVLQAMELQVAAERRKRAEILESEGQRQSAINIAEGDKQQVVLSSEGALTDQVNRAKGESEAILAVAHATAEGIRKVAEALQNKGGSDAASLRVAEKYVEAFEKLAKTNNTILLPADVGNAGSMVAQALTIFDSLKGDSKAPNSPWGVKK
ncbi:MAG: regulator of protease activity HflC (stomatin/prohibitin superfamily) [Lentimonas sp.]|jgi:regulator of protease activity HflC (stomatin/prohibitin superfamily)